MKIKTKTAYNVVFYGAATIVTASLVHSAYSIVKWALNIII